jgi:ribosomal protein S6--L-glutamate ligase
MKNLKIGYWNIQTDIKKSLENKNVNTTALDWHKNDWQKEFIKHDCDAHIWYPHLHHQWFKLLDRAGFVELFLNKKIFPSLKTSYLFQDKMHQKYIFDLYQIPYPKTYIATSKIELETILSENKSFPIFIKDIWGFGGEAPKNKEGIIVLKNKKRSTAFADSKKWPEHLDQINQDDYVYIQEAIDIKSEYRVVTVGQKVLTAYEKKSDQIMKHVWRGATINWDIDPKIEKFVKEVNQKLKLDWCGYDVLEDKNGNLMILELNPIFGTKSLEEKGINLSDHLVEFAINEINKDERNEETNKK